MKTELLIGEGIDPENYPDAVIVTPEDAYKIYDMKEGTKIFLSGNFTKGAELKDTGYLFYLYDESVTRFDENFVRLTINKFYYVGQKVKTL